MCNIPKNRSNIAASILQNPEMLEEVYEKSKDSAGSAQQELDKYLDSITGKVTKLQNAIQQLSFNVVDSEPLKVIIDLLTGAVKLVNTLVENVGSLNLVIGGAAGILTTKFGKGFFQYDKLNGLDVGPKLLSSIKDAKKPIIEEIKGMSDYADDLLISQMDKSVFSSLSADAQNAIEKVKQLKGENTELRDVITSLEHPITGVGGALSKVGGIAANLVLTLGNMIVNIGLSMLASAVIKIIADIITYQDRLIEKSKEAQTAISDAFNTFKEQTSSFDDMQISLGIEIEEDQDIEDTISNIAEKYSELHEGVNGITNENISLTNDEYQQYLDTCNKLAEQNPSLVNGWDSQGNAILNLGASADEARIALMGMYEAQQLTANVEIGNNLNDLYNGVSIQSDAIDKENAELDKQNELLTKQAEWEAGHQILDLSGYTLTASVSESLNGQIIDIINSVLGPDAYDQLADKSWFDPSNNTIVYYLDQLEGITDEKVQQINDALANIGSDTNGKIAENTAQKHANELRKADLWASVEGSVSQYLQTSKTFTGINDQIQSAILGNLSNVDLTNLGNYDTILDFVYGEILEPMDGLNEEVQEKLAEAFTLDTSKISKGEYVGEIAPMLQEIFGVDWLKWAKQLGFQDIVDELQSATDTIYAEFGNNLTKEQEDVISDMSIDMLRNAKRLLSERSYEPDDFSAFWRDLNKKPTKAPGTGTLTDIFNDEGYSKEASTFTSNLSEIKTAIEQVGESGSVASDEVTKLLETGMKFDNFELSGLSKTGTDVLSDWIKRLHEMADAMDLSDDAMKDFDQYIASIVASYSNLLDIDPQKFITSVVGASLARAGEGSSTGQVVGEITNELGERLQSENAEEILFLLKADGTLASGQIQQIVDKWDQYEIELEITADAEEFERRAAQAARDAARQSYEETSNSLKEAFGDTLTQDDYWGIIGQNTSQMLSKSAEVNDLKAFRDGIKNKNSKEYYEADTNYWNSMTDLMNLRLKGQEAFKAQQEAGAAEINRSIEEMQNTRSALEAQVTEATNQGLKAGPGTYYKLQAVTKNMAQQQRDLYDYWMEKASKTSNQSWALEWTKNAQDALNEAMSLESDSLNYLMQPTQDMIDELGVSMNGLQTEATNIQSVMSSREAKGIKPIVKDYNRLIKNSKQQIKNLNDQNKLLQRQQTYLKQGSEKWREIQDQIESNKSSIREMVDSQYEWGQNMTMSAITNTSNLLSQLQSAASTGHMDSSSLQELISMARGNADDILTTTTTGSYADPQAIRELYEQYSELGLSIVNTQMAAEQLDFSNNEKEMLRLGKRLDPTIEDINDLHRAMAQNPDNPDYAKIFDLDEENQGILQTITNLQSLEEEILANSSALGQYQAALSSANWSDPMQTIRGGMESADKLYDQGWWGKDDFTTYANLIATNDQLKDKTGWAAIDAYETNREAVKRYLTEDVTGVDNWVDDMVSKSKELGEEWATLDEQGNYTFNIDDMEKFATAMGRSTEFAEYMLMAMKDANYDIDISRIDDEFSRTFNNISGSEANAAQQVKNLVTEMQNVALAGGDISQGAEAAGSALMRMREAGVSDDVINSLVEELNLLGEFNGFHIDPKTLEVTTTVDTNEIDEVDESISKPRRLMVEYGVEEDSVKEAHNTIIGHWKGNEENIRYATKALSDYTAEELLAIDHADGQWSEGEKAVEEFAESLGLPLNQINAIIIALEEMGVLKSDVEIESEPVETEVEVETKDAETQVENFAQEESDAPIEKNVEVKGVDGPSLKKLEEVEQNIRNKQIEQTVDIKLSEGSITPKEVSEMTDEQIKLHFGVSGAEEVQKVRDYVSEINAADGYDLTVHIDETQMSSILEALNPENPIEVEVDDDPWTTFVKDVEDTDLTVTIKTKLETPTDTPTGSTSIGNQNTGGSSNAGKSGNQGYKPSGDIIDNKSAQSSINDINSMLNSLDVGETYITIDGAMAIAQINAFNNKITNLEHGESYITIDGTMAIAQIGAFNKMITTELAKGYSTINVDGGNAIKQINAFNSMIDSVHDGKSVINVDGSNAVRQINAFNTKIDSINDGSATVSVSGVASALSQVNNLIRQLDSLNGKVSTYTVVRKNQSSGSSNLAGEAPKALGTAHAFGDAFAFGNAYASGQNWGVPDNEDALVNEVGQESIVIFCDDIR